MSSSDFIFNKSGKYFKIVKLEFATSEATNQAVNFAKFDIFLASKELICLSLSQTANCKQTLNFGIYSAILQATKL